MEPGAKLSNSIRSRSSPVSNLEFRCRFFGSIDKWKRPWKTELEEEAVGAGEVLFFSEAEDAFHKVQQVQTTRNFKEREGAFIGVELLKQSFSLRFRGESSSSVSSLQPANTYKAIPNLHPCTQYTLSNKSCLIGYAGVAKIENGSILLNSLIYSGIGRAVYGQPLHLKNSSNGKITDFSTRFSFTIQSPYTIYGDGFGFYVAPLSYQIPNTMMPAGYGLGLYDENIPILAVEFDTFINDFDPPVQHVGINNGSVVSLNYTKFDIESNRGNMGHALITYNASAELLAVSWFFDETSSASTPDAYLSYQIDLAELLPEWVAIGFSGATGSSIEENVIHSWEFNSSLDLINFKHREANKETVIKIEYKGRGKVVVVAVIWSIIFALVVISITCWMMKKRRNEDGFGFDREATPRRDFNAKLSDFGMAKLVDPRLRSEKTRVVGTYGYLAPEYVKEGRASKESDMYSFGVLALEIACGRRTYQDVEYNQVPLRNWVWKHYVDGKILNAADEKLKKDFDVSEITCLLTVGIWCTLEDHKERPTAEEVINVLQQKVSLPMLSTKHP
ncbi:hypothetical protein VNO80_02526 [Phaseolus coccineus]|uniref:non-specific serine/threonine protein kinase n=1 Tax=Phaseolus coccineus TaxID=3886 RepID=A0AAN9RLL6_PHACN